MAGSGGAVKQETNKGSKTRLLLPVRLLRGQMLQGASVTRVLIELARLGSLADTDHAARELTAPAAVCRAWHDALTDEVWQTIFERASPAALHAPRAPLPASVFVWPDIGQ